MADIVFRHPRVALTLAWWVQGWATVMRVPVFFRFGNQGSVSQDQSE